MTMSYTTPSRSFSERLRTKWTNEVHNLNEAHWIRFLQDHRDLIRARSSIMTLDKEIMYRYRYRIRDFLVKYGLEAQHEQVFRVINRLHDDKDFNFDLHQVYLPNRAHVEELREMYGTIRSRLAKMY